MSKQNNAYCIYRMALFVSLGKGCRFVQVKIQKVLDLNSVFTLGIDTTIKESCQVSEGKKEGKRRAREHII